MTEQSSSVTSGVEDVLPSPGDNTLPDVNFGNLVQELEDRDKFAYYIAAWCLLLDFEPPDEIVGTVDVDDVKKEKGFLHGISTFGIAAVLFVGFLITLRVILMALVPSSSVSLLTTAASGSSALRGIGGNDA